MFRYLYDVSRDPPAPVLPIRVGAPGADSAMLLTALVDTGADISVVPVEVPRRLGLPVIGQISVRGLAGTTRRVPVYGAEIETEMGRLPAELIGVGQEVIIGRDFLNLWTLFLRGPRRVIEIIQGKPNVGV